MASLTPPLSWRKPPSSCWRCGSSGRGRAEMPMTSALSLRMSRGLARYGVLIALLGLIAFGWLRYDNFLGSYNVLSVLRYNSMFALVALGMCFVIMTGGIDLS